MGVIYCGLVGVRGSSYHPPPSARADWKASLISVASKPLSDIAHLHERSDALSR